MPLTLIGEAVFARFLSALKDERAVRVRSCLQGPAAAFTGDRAASSPTWKKPSMPPKIVSYTQGYMLMRAAAAAYGWNLNFGGIALMWRGGCIIRSAFLGKIKDAFDADPNLTNLLMAPYFRDAVAAAKAGWRRVVATAVDAGHPGARHWQRTGLL